MLLHMIFSMMARDVWRFIILYGLMTLGFANGMFIAFKYNSAVLNVPEGFSSAFESINTVVMFMFGELDSDIFLVNTPLTVRILFYCYAVITVIVMLNLIIAMMGETFGIMNDRAELCFRMHRAEWINDTDRQIRALLNMRGFHSLRNWFNFDFNREQDCVFIWREDYDD